MPVKTLTYKSWPILTLLFLNASVGEACGGIGRAGAPVRFLGQSNIIVWESKAGVEHFIRNARFDSKAKDFGFLAPSPTIPELAVINGAAFDLLDRLEPRPAPVGCSAPPAENAPAAGSKSVEVLQVVEIGGYEATTVKSTDASGLRSWLTTHNYPTSKGIEEWLGFYVKKGWCMTAFKVVDRNQMLTTGPIRMSFKTNKPFTPYYVPAENFEEQEPDLKSPNHRLQIRFVSDEVYTGSREDRKPWVPASWDAQIPPMERDALLDQLKLPSSSATAMLHVTSFTDPNFPNPSTGDLYFEKDRRLTTPITVTLVIFAAAGWWWIRGKRRAVTHPK